MLLNESVVLLDRDDKIQLDLVNAELELNIQFEFIFSTQGEKYKSETVIPETNKVIITLFQWDSDNALGPIENTVPLKLDLDNGKCLLLKFRTQTYHKHSFRNFQITAWWQED